MNQERIDYLMEMREVNPDDPFPNYGLAMEYRQSKPEKAIDILESLITKNKDYLPAYYQLCDLYEEFERQEDGVEIAEKGILLAQRLGDKKTEDELKVKKLNMEMEL